MLRTLAKIVAPIVMSTVALGQLAAPANADDLGAKRRQLEAQRAQAASQLNVLKASQGQIQKALDALDHNIAAQQAALDGARQAADAAAFALQQAQKKEADAAAQVAKLKSNAADAALDAYVGRSKTATFDALRTGDLAAVARQREYFNIALSSTSATLDQLRAAREDLLAQRRAAQRARQQTEARRSQAQASFVGLVQAQKQQQQFADQVENKIAVTEQQSGQLAQQSSQLANQIAAQQAAQSRSTSNSSVTRTSGNICLQTVRTITVACSIAAQLDKMLGAAEGDGFTFTGGGYRSPDQQVAVREKNCGSSQYAVYQEPPEDCSPPTAYPGTSMHEQGLAIDFMWNGSIISSHSSPAWQWLNTHAATFGFYNLPSEPWHWSVNGH